MRRSPAVLLVVSLFACSSEVLGPGGPFPPVVSLASPGAWAGGELQVRSAAFAASNTEVHVTLGGQTLAETRVVDDTTIGFAVPAALAGNHPLVVTVDTFQVTLPAVTVYGMTGLRSYPGGIIDPVPSTIKWRRGEAAAVLVDYDAGLASIDLDAGTVGTFPGTLHALGLTGPGPTSDPDVWLLHPASDGNIERWRLFPTVARLDTLPRAYFGTNQRSLIAMFGPSAVAAFVGDLGTVWHQTTATAWAQDHMMNYEGDRRIGIAPGGARATLRTSGGFHDFGASDGRGVAVFDGTDGSIAYVLPVAWRSVDAFDFSDDGADLALVTGTSVNGLSLLKMVAAVDGALEWETDFGTTRIFGLGFDPWRPYLYAALHDDHGMALAVLDRATGQEIARLPAACGLHCWDEAQVVVSPAEAVYVVETGEPGEGVVATRFSLPPADKLP